MRFARGLGREGSCRSRGNSRGAHVNTGLVEPADVGFASELAPPAQNGAELKRSIDAQPEPFLKMDYLAKLESQSIYLLREAFNKFENLAMLWSIGKDSTVLLWLARKAFFGHVPFP